MRSPRRRFAKNDADAGRRLHKQTNHRRTFPPRKQRFRMSSFLARGEARGRVLAADAALVIDETDGQMGTIIVSSTTGAKAATFSWDTPTDTLGGAKFQIYCAARSGGSYTVACTYAGSAGTLTIDAANEAPVLHRIGSTLYCLDLGGSTFA